MAIKLKRFSKKSKLFGYDDYDPSSAEYGWMLHCISDGKEYIFYSDDELYDDKKDCQAELDDFISLEENNIEKVLHKRVSKCDGTDYVSEWKNKYPNAEVEGV